MFSHTIRRSGDKVCLTLTGELEYSGRGRLSDVLTGALSSRPVTLRVDVGGVSYLDCATIGTLIQARKAAENNGTRLVLCHPRGVVLRVLLVLHLLPYLAGVPAPTASPEAFPV